MQGDWRDVPRKYNRMLLNKAVNAEGVMQESSHHFTKAVEERVYFTRIAADLRRTLLRWGRKVELSATERLRVLHDFYRAGESFFNFSKGHDEENTTSVTISVLTVLRSMLIISDR